MHLLKKFFNVSSMREFFTIYWLALAIMLLSGVLQLFGFDNDLRYDRQLVSSTEPWRFLSANFVHLNWSHYWLNMGALGLLWLMFVHRLSTIEWLIVFILSSLIISSGIQFLNTNLYWYLGLSGTLHGVMSAGVWRELRYDKIFALSVGGLTFLKLIYEQFYGALPGSEENVGSPVIVDAHFYGAIGGIISVILLDLLQHLKKISSYNF